MAVMGMRMFTYKIYLNYVVFYYAQAQCRISQYCKEKSIDAMLLYTMNRVIFVNQWSEFSVSLCKGRRVNGSRQTR